MLYLSKWYRYFIAILLAIWATGYSNKLSAQCDFSVSAIVQKESDCQSNGIILAALSGTDVDNGNIDLTDAKFGINSTTTSYVQIPVSNNGVITNVPPGSYAVTVQAYCKKSNSWVVKTFSTVTVTGSYIVPDINKMYVVSASINKSLKCEPTGSVPIKAEGGKPPYTITISTAPGGYSGATSFTQPTEGVVTIPNLPAGSYIFDISDACTYTIYGLQATVDEIQPLYTIGTITHTPVCAFDGVIPITVSDGVPPYTIEVDSAPGTYTGAASFTVPVDGVFNIVGLPQGTYTFKVKDKCYEETLTATVNEIPFVVSKGVVTGTTTCTATGSVAVEVGGGRAPYTATITSYPPCYLGPWSHTFATSGSYDIGGLCEGGYTITVTDDCGTSKVIPGIAIFASHLSASLVSVANATASCTATGSATIKIEGGAKPYTGKLISSPLGYVDPGTLSIPNPTSSYKINNLAPGSYDFEFEDACGEKDTVSFTVNADPMTAIVLTKVSSFGCIATGQLVITVNGGKPPYTVVMDAPIPGGYGGPTSGFTPTTPNGNVFEIHNLPNGTYTFTITDACGDTITKPGVVADLPVNFPHNFYYDYFLPPSPNDSDCKEVRIRRNTDATGDLGIYWNTNPSKYYEVAFEEDISLPKPVSLLDWHSVTDAKDSAVTLSRTYCQMRTDGGYIVAFLRVKGDGAFLCGIDTDTIRMADIETKFGTPYDQSCAGYSIKFNQYKDERGLFCYPYTWRLLDENSNEIMSQSPPINTPASQTVTNIPYGKHVFEFTDASGSGCSWYSDTLSYYWSPLPVVNSAIERSCGFYDYAFKVEDVCPPFDWNLLDQLNSVVASKTNIPATGIPEKVLNLQYGQNYTLEVVYNGGSDTTSFAVIETAAQYHNYKISFEPCYCLPDTGKGAIILYRDATMPDFEEGSLIEFVSGPTIPVHASMLIEAANIDKVYPFSVDSLAHSHQDILPGLYEFQLTDTCGIVHPLTMQYGIATLDGFGYTVDETCSGVKVFPEGTISLDGVAQPTYFRISSAPAGIAVSPNSVTIPNYLFLPESGQYEIQVSAENSPTSCPFAKFIVDYEKLSVSLDADSTEAYVCEGGGVGFIKVVRKGGIGPFEYELFDQGVCVGRNSIGKFSYGSPGSTYTIRVKDQGCRVSFDQDITLINLANERLIYGTTGYCPGYVIELNSLPVNTTGYYWEGPNGFTSNDQHPRINNADTVNEGVYTLSVHPEGCTGAIKQTVEAVNHKPDLPMASQVSIVCLNTVASPLKATVSSSDNVLKWYDKNGTTPLSYAPVPSTAVVDTITYYVSQVNSIWGCESDKIPVKAAISDLPSILLQAEGPVICPGMMPTVVLPSTNTGYTYNLYNANSGGTLMGIGYSNGDTLKIRSSTPITSMATFYVEVVDSNTCVSPGRKAVTAKVENYLEIKPDALPEYKRGKLYSVQLQSNAAEPSVYSSDYSLPLGFDLSKSGLISGMPPGNGYIEPKSFDVKLKDANGCIATKMYMLKSEPFIPNTFTPNGDGYNDVFMKGHHLIIFDRLGVVIFEGNDGWDGKRNNGKKAPADTYFYILDYEHDDKTISKRKGYITVLER